MQLKDMGGSKAGKKAPCTLCLNTQQWHMLYKATYKKLADKNKVATVKWAYQSLGKLAGWNDSKKPDELVGRPYMRVSQSLIPFWKLMKSLNWRCDQELESIWE
jgi:hypothetical protein